MKKNICFRIMVLIGVLFTTYNNLSSEVVLDGFEYGFSSYKIIGNQMNVQLDSNLYTRGKYSVRIGESDIKLQRKVVVEKLAILQFNVYVKNHKNIANSNFYISLEYYDINDKLINEFKSYYKDTSWGVCEINMITPPLASYAIVSYNYIYDSLNSFVNIDDTYWNTNTLSIPENDEDEFEKYTIPFWASDTIYDESILMISSNNKLPQGNLLFNPLKILSINNSYLQKQYIQSKDYNVTGKDIISTSLNEIPFYNDTTFAKDVYWYNLMINGKQNYPQWINVTYTSNRDWQGSKIKSKTHLLENTYYKLKNKDSLRIAVLGNSIARGMYVSGLSNFKPNMENYFTIFCKYLSRYYKNNYISNYNLSLPGALAKQYGVESISHYIKPVNPDLLLIDFGLADFWGTSPIEFSNAISRIIDSVKSLNNKCEFILITDMRFDPAYLQDTSRDYIKSCYSNLKGYQTELQKFEKKGIVNIDMYTLSDSLQKWKKPKDLLVDPVHPNDYMARWYAQSLISALVPVMSGSINKIVNRVNELVVDNNESSDNNSEVTTNEIVISNKQDWELYKLPNGNNRILSNFSKLALVIENDKLIQTTIKDTASQEWELIPLDNNYYKLKNAASQKYLSMDTVSNKLILENESNSNAQQWNIFYSYKKEELTINRDTTIADYTVDSSQYIQIESNTQWTAATTANWIHLDKNQGNGNKLLKLSIDENIEKSQRSAFIEISTNGLKKQHYVVQNGSKTNINDSVEEKFNVKIIPPTENDNNIYLICEDCLISNITIEIFDLTGRVVFQKEYLQSSQMIKIESNQFSSSQYLIKVSNGSHSQLLKFVITK